MPINKIIIVLCLYERTNTILFKCVRKKFLYDRKNVETMTEIKVNIKKLVKIHVRICCAILVNILFKIKFNKP